MNPGVVLPKASFLELTTRQGSWPERGPQEGQEKCAEGALIEGKEGRGKTEDEDEAMKPPTTSRHAKTTRPRNRMRDDFRRPPDRCCPPKREFPRTLTTRRGSWPERGPQEGQEKCAEGA